MKLPDPHTERHHQNGHLSRTAERFLFGVSTYLRPQNSHTYAMTLVNTSLPKWKRGLREKTLKAEHFKMKYSNNATTVLQVLPPQMKK